MFELRPITPDEYLPFARTTLAAFGAQRPDEELEAERDLFEFDRSLGAFDRGKIVGTGEIFSFELTLPGATRMPAGGVTWIAVLPTHRRQGILTAIMRRQLADMREREEPVGILYASEAGIYGRFGYGLSTFHSVHEIDRPGVQLLQDVTSGTLSLLSKDEARAELPKIYEAWRLGQPGAVSRSDAYWDYWLKDPERWRDGWSARFYVGHYDDSGASDGYVSYRIKDEWDDAGPKLKLRIGQLMTTNPNARLNLWSYCTRVDLVRTITTESLPAEEPFRWVLRDPRALRTRLEDSLWLRLVDIPKALAARRYAVEGSVVIAVQDDFLPENSGRYELEGGPDGAISRPTKQDPDFKLHVTDLAAVYLGGNRLTTLLRAGRVEENSPGSTAHAEAMFASDPAPFCGTHF